MTASSKRLAEFDAAAGQRVEAVGGRPRPAHDQHAAVAEYGRADREIRPRRISPRIVVVAHRTPAAFRLMSARRRLFWILSASRIISPLSHVRTLCHHLAAGGDQGAVRLRRAAEFSAALQRGADAADPHRAPCRRQAPIRAGALGSRPVLGQGPKNLLAAHQCARRIGHRQAGLSRRHAPAALPHPGRRLL